MCVRIYVAHSLKQVFQKLLARVLCMQLTTTAGKSFSLEGSKMAVSWIIAPCSLVELYQRHDNRGSKDL